MQGCISRRLIAAVCLLVTGLSGCAAFRPIQGVPAACLPEDMKVGERSGRKTIDLSLLKQSEERNRIHRIDSGDILAIYVEGLVGKIDAPPPINIPLNEDSNPTFGYPLPVREDGTVSLPYIGSVSLRGMSIAQAEDTVRQKYLDGSSQKEYLKPGFNRVQLSLHKPRHYRVLVIRQDSRNEPQASDQQGGFNLGYVKRGTAKQVMLPVGRNDVLNALTRTDGLPGLDAESAVYIIRQRGNSRAGTLSPDWPTELDPSRLIRQSQRAAQTPVIRAQSDDSYNSFGSSRPSRLSSSDMGARPWPQPAGTRFRPNGEPSPNDLDSGYGSVTQANYQRGQREPGEYDVVQVNGGYPPGTRFGPNGEPVERNSDRRFSGGSPGMGDRNGSSYGNPFEDSFPGSASFGSTPDRADIGQVNYSSQWPGSSAGSGRRFSPRGEPMEEDYSQGGSGEYRPSSYNNRPVAYGPSGEPVSSRRMGMEAPSGGTRFSARGEPVESTDRRSVRFADGSSNYGPSGEVVNSSVNRRGDGLSLGGTRFSPRGEPLEGTSSRFFARHSSNFDDNVQPTSGGSRFSGSGPRASVPFSGREMEAMSRAEKLESAGAWNDQADVPRQAIYTNESDGRRIQRMQYEVPGQYDASANGPALAPNGSTGSLYPVPEQQWGSPVLSQPQHIGPHQTGHMPSGNLPTEVMGYGPLGGNQFDGRHVIRIPIRLGPGESADITEEDVILHDGDIVFIESRDTEVFFTGGLLGGGQITLPRDYDLNILEAISIAQSRNNGNTTGRRLGGVSALNNDVSISPSNVIVLRKLPDGSEIPIKIDLYRARTDQNERVFIQPGDYILLQYTPLEAVAAFFERHLLEGALFALASQQFTQGGN